MYQLKTKNGNLVFSASAESFEQAVEYFSKIKRLTIDVLLSLFVVVPTTK
jgi:hypothetical protein